MIRKRHTPQINPEDSLSEHSVPKNRIDVDAGTVMNSAVIILTLFSVLGGSSFAKANPVERSTGCSVLINGGLAEPQPLILWPGTNAGFAVPQKTGTGSITLSAGETLRLNCLGTSNRFDIGTTTEAADDTVTCVSGSNFSFKNLGVTKAFEEIACLSYPTHTARRTGVACPNGEVCEIGFDLGGGDFQVLMTTCHDDVNHHTIIAHAKVPAVIDSSQTSFPRPGFVKGNFYSGISMSTIYTRVNQRATLAKIVGSESLALEYIPASGNFYLAKGHLAAKTDFIYGSQQRATFYYLNTVPMWQNVNAGNWGTMEANIRNLATNRNVDLDIWSGSIGTLTLPDVNGVEREFHLSVDDNNNRAVPVPKIIFKVVYEEKSRTGAVFVTANNPYLTTLTSDYVVCKNICDKITYLTWNPATNTRGLSYCCEVDDFRKTFGGLPAFTTSGILG